MIKYKKIPPGILLPILRNVTIFSGLTEHEINAISNNCDIMDASVGDVLLEEGKAATEIFVILQGRINLLLNIHDNPLEIFEFGPGYCIGEASVIGIQNHSASAVVMQEASLLILSRKVLMDIFESDSRLFSLLILNIAREIARRLHHTDEILLHYGRKMRERKK
ncbi:MAG: cyclic nucleotide-binding domain-containing protein [Chitinispirillales bacterium]|jgi:CRP-like cAMP-binding protein|nr:cyclic nucleotide-binding domain-containing protein [Chitinispirillales bacterium]